MVPILMTLLLPAEIFLHLKRDDIFLAYILINILKSLEVWNICSLATWMVDDVRGKKEAKQLWP